MKKKKILLIDDEKDFTDLTGALLHYNNFDVETLNDSSHLDDAISRDGYDLIVSDLLLPDMNGFQLIENLRKTSSYRDIPMIALSAKILTEEERKFLFRNNVHYLTKPFEASELVQQITMKTNQECP